MSDATGTRQRPVGTARGGGGSMGGGHHGRMGGMPAEKPKNFRATLKRLLRYLKPRSAQLALVFVLAPAAPCSPFSRRRSWATPRPASSKASWA